MFLRKICKLMLAALAMGMCLQVRAQQPQAQTQPLYAVNAKYVNGVAPGYWATPGSGLTLNLGAGTANCGTGTIAAYAGGTLSMTASVTNYVYLNTASSCVPAVKTSAFVAADIPIAVVVTSGSAITGITDDRTMFNAPSSGGSGSGNMSFTSPGTWSGTSAYPTVGTVVTYGNASYVNNTAVTAPAAATLVQAKSANNASSLAFTSNVTSGNLLVAIVGSTQIGGAVTPNVGSATVTDTLSGLGWTKAVDTGANTGAASGIWYFRATASGATTVSFTGAVLGTPQIAIAEFSGLNAITTGTATGYVSSGTPATVSLTPVISGSTIVAGIDSSFSSSYGAASGFTIPSGGQSATFTQGSVAIDYQVGVGTSTYAAGFTSATSSTYATAAAAFTAATTNDTPDMDTGHWTLLGQTAAVDAVNNSSDLTATVTGTKNQTLNLSGGPTRAGIQQQTYTYAADTGSANAYAVTLSPAPTIGAGSVATFIVGHTNTGASTLAVNGGGATTVFKQGSSNLIAGDWTAGQAVAVEYDGSHWQWLGTTPGTGGAGFTLTTTGACGAATLTGTVLNVPTCSQITTQTSYTSSTRVLGTVYHNTLAVPLYVKVTTLSPGGTPNFVGITDSSSSPSTLVDIVTYQNVVGFAYSISFWVLPGNYYKATSTGTWESWTEWH